MNMLFCAASPGLYSFFTNKAYPSTFFPFPTEVPSVPDFSTCNFDNEHETMKATNARNHKLRADIVTMNAALSDVFFVNLPKAICERHEPICMKQPNTVFHTCLTGSSRSMAKQQPKIAKIIGSEWPPTDIPPMAPSPL